MKYAGKVSEIINAFSPAPLKTDQMDEFYCNNTMEYRTSDKYSSPIEDIFDSCQTQEEGNAFLLLGHRGCGKSTELNKMSERLIEKGYHVKTINCGMDLDLLNIVYSDLFIIMGEALLKIAEEAGCKIQNNILDNIMNFWNDGIEIATCQETAAASAERQKISIRSSEWIRILGHVSDEIARQTDGKYPVIIFEDIDKLNPEDAWTLFYNYVTILSGMKFPVIYTFPIALSYDTRFSAMESYFTTKTLPMIKIRTIEDEPFQDGINVICKIVEKRADLELFEINVLKKLVQDTGGSLRDLFHVINSSAKRAVRRNSETISMEDAEHALEELKTSLTRRIEEKDYEFLLNIYNGNKERITNKEMLLKMLQASVVLEYNGKRWHNLHPLVTKFLIDQGLVTDD